MDFLGVVSQLADFLMGVSLPVLACWCFREGVGRSRSEKLSDTAEHGGTRPVSLRFLCSFS